MSKLYSRHGALLCRFIDNPNDPNCKALRSSLMNYFETDPEGSQWLKEALQAGPEESQSKPWSQLHKAIARFRAKLHYNSRVLGMVSCLLMGAILIGLYYRTSQDATVHLNFEYDLSASSAFSRGNFVFHCLKGDLIWMHGNSKSYDHADVVECFNSRWDVDVKTGKVTVVTNEDPKDHRAVLTGSLISWESSPLVSVGGDSGQRQLHITARNNSNQTPQNGARIIIGDLKNTSNIDYKAETLTSTFAGSGVSGSLDGYRTAAQFNNPQGIAVGDGPNRNAIFIADQGSSVIRKVETDGTVHTFAGTAGQPGFADGIGPAAKFNSPNQLSVDGAGNVFVADSSNNRIRRITPTGEVTTIAGSGNLETGTNDDGPANTANFSVPNGIAVSQDGNRIYVSDYNSYTIRRIIWNGVGPRQNASSYTVSTIAGGAQGFQFPAHLALIADTLGNDVLMVASYGNYAIRRIDNPQPGSAVVTTIAGINPAGDEDGLGSEAHFWYVWGIAAVPVGSGNYLLFITELVGRVRGILYTPGNDPRQAGSYRVVTIAGVNGSGGYVDGDGTVSRFNYPSDICALKSTGPSATLFLTDEHNNRIRQLTFGSGILASGAENAGTETVRPVNADAEIPNQTAWAKNAVYTNNTFSADLQFYIPNGVSGFSFTAYIQADTNLINLPTADPGGSHLSTLAGDGTAYFSDGPGKLAQLNHPSGIVAVPAAMRSLYGSVSSIRAFFVDPDNNTVRYVDSKGNVGTFAGNTSPGFQDGVGSAARFRQPRGITLTPDGSLIVTDAGNRRIRRISPDRRVSTIAGTGVQGSTDGVGNLARFGLPEGITVDGGGNITLVDTQMHVVRRIIYTSGDPTSASSYTVLTIAGSPGLSGNTDGIGLAARFKSPTDIVADTDGTLYVADGPNGLIRKLTRSSSSPLMNVTTLATGFLEADGIAMDTAKNLCVSDFAANLIKRVSPSGNVVTLMGGGQGFTDGTSGTFNGPHHLIVEETGTIVISDQGKQKRDVLKQAALSLQKEPELRPPESIK